MNTIKITPYITNWTLKRLEYISNNNIKVLRYKTGSFSHALIRLLCIKHDLSYGNVTQVRVNDDKDHWVLIVRNDKKIRPFKESALLY